MIFTGPRCSDVRHQAGAACRVSVLASGLGHTERLALVDEAFRSLPERYLGADPGFDATYHVKLSDLGHTWEVRCTSHGARVRKGATRRRPDVTLWTDAETWTRLREGHTSGVEAFQRRQLSVRGNLDYAVGFEGMFRRPGGAGGGGPAGGGGGAAAADPRCPRGSPPRLDADHG